MGIGKGAGFGLLDERELEEEGGGTIFFTITNFCYFEVRLKSHVCHCSSTRRRN
jgi:hypothetical protein